MWSPVCDVFKEEQTNEAWMKALDTEDFAEMIFIFINVVSEGMNGKKITNKEEIKREVIIKWLKEHKE